MPRWKGRAARSTRHQYDDLVFDGDGDGDDDDDDDDVGLDEVEDAGDVGPWRRFDAGDASVCTQLSFCDVFRWPTVKKNEKNGLSLTTCFF